MPPEDPLVFLILFLQRCIYLRCLFCRKSRFDPFQDCICYHASGYPFCDLRNEVIDRTSEETGGWPRHLILRALAMRWVPRSFAFFAKGRESEMPARQLDLITRSQQNQIAHAASPPTPSTGSGQALAKNAGCPISRAFCEKACPERVEGWGFSPPRYQLSASPPPLRLPSMAPPCDEMEASRAVKTS